MACNASCPLMYFCSKAKEGTLLLPFINESGIPRGSRIVMYFIALMWMFMGVAIGADLFMCAIEVITSKTKMIRIGNQDEDGKGYEEVEVRFWNDTCANLTLMALGSSAPEILLSIIEIVGNNFQAGELGPGTIVGSAAFNLFVITAVCVMSIGGGEVRQINSFGVFLVTSFFAIFAYIWMFIVLSVSSPNVMDLWEAALTLLFFPMLVVIAYIADKELCSNILLKRRKRQQIELNNLDLLNEKVLKKNHPDFVEYMKEVAANPNISEEEAAQLIAIKIEQSKKKNYGHYRVGALRFFGGGKKMVPRVADKLQGMLEGAAVANVAMVDVDDDGTAVSGKRSKIEFAAMAVSVLESDKRVELSLVRSMDLTQTVSVQFETVDGTAEAGSDYIAKKGEIVFQPNETEKQLEIEIIDDYEWEPDEMFFVKLHSDPNDAKVMIGKHCIAEVTIINDDDPGTFQFTKPSHIVKESCGKVCIEVERVDGADGKVELTWKTKDQSALHAKDYIGGEGVLEFHTGETSKTIDIEIIDDHHFEKDETFMVELTEVTCEGAKLGRLRRTVVTIVSDDEYKRMFDRVVNMAHLNLDKFAFGSETWGQQFVQAMNVNGGDVEGASLLDYIMHFLTFFWKVLFAFVPPCGWAGGWIAFFVILGMIGIMTALIGDLATIFGCLIGLKKEVTAITFVALGTSLPDLFASRAAAMNEKYADASVGNVTGSNGVNVFLGLGIPWLIAAIYHKVNDQKFETPAGTLATSVVTYALCAIACVAILIMRRFVGFFGKGELGGPTGPKLVCGVLMIGMWFIYVLISALVSYEHLSPLSV